MIKNYFKVAFRNLLKNKTFGLLNIAGLAIGITCTALILLWVEDELNFDSSIEGKSNVYQLLGNQTYDGKTYTFPSMPGPLAQAIKQEIPGIKNAARTDWGDRLVFALGDKSTYEYGMMADPSFLDIFSVDFTNGDKSSAFDDPYSVVISQTMAKKYFGDGDPVGRTLKVENQFECKVTGVFKDLPANTTYSFDWLIPFKNYEEMNSWLKSWQSNSIQTFVQLETNADAASINNKLKNFVESKDTAATVHPFLFSANDWRLRTNFVDGKQAGGRIETLRLFFLIALIILIIACINFMNLSTARSEQRAREVGVRKVMGAAKSKLVMQFMSESLLLSFIAVVISVILISLLLAPFNQLVGKQLTLQLINPIHTGVLFTIGLVTGLLAGSYPSLYLSSFNPVAVLKNLKAGAKNKAILVRKGLVVTQFVISIVLIISTIIIYQQIQFAMNRTLGYNKDHLMYIELSDNLRNHFKPVKDDLMSTGVVSDAAVSLSVVTNMGRSGNGFEWEGKAAGVDPLVIQELVSPGYLSTMGMHLHSGRDFYDAPEVDSSSVIINETFAKIMNNENPVGDFLTRGSSHLKIIGVIDDFMYNGVYTPPSPMIIYCDPKSTNYLFVRLKEGDTQQQLAKIQNVIKAANPGYPFDYKFLDDTFDKLFRSEILTGKLSRLFSILAIIITCLGLFGLAAYTAERRTKEIGIRKVLGASLASIVSLLSRDFLLLVSVGALIAFPIAWWMMNKWLQNYSYRVTITWWVFVLAAFMALLVTVVTVSFQSIKAAIANPVKSLRAE